MALKCLGLTSEEPDPSSTSKASRLPVSNVPHIRTSSIQNLAVARGFSKRGEMFSAPNMAQLARECVAIKGPASAAYARVIESAGNLASIKVLSSIFASPPEGDSMQTSSSVLLVPYDTDSSQRPALKRGLSAHWCLVLGFVMISSQKGEDRVFEKLEARLKRTELPSVGSVFLVEDISAADAMHLEGLAKARESNEADGPVLTLYLLARQSKSRRLFLFQPQNLLESNQNLELSPRADGEEVARISKGGEKVGSTANLLPRESPARSECEGETRRGNEAASEDPRYVLPPGGTKEGLCGKMVLISTDSRELFRRN